MANHDVQVDENDQLLDPGDEGVANDDGPDGDDRVQDQDVIEEPVDAEQTGKEENLAAV